MADSDRLSAFDATFLNLEQEELPMHVGSLMIFEGPTPGIEEFRATFNSRLDRIVRYRQRVRGVPLHISTPVWVDDEHFSIEYHIRHVALPAPGTDEQLRTLASRILGMRLDMARPLWETWLIEGVRGDRWALLNKTHHAMIDGVSGSDMMEVMLEVEPTAHPTVDSVWDPDTQPSTMELVSSAVRDTVMDPVRVVEHVASSLRAPRSFARMTAARALGALQTGRQFVHTEDYFTGPVGPHRRWNWIGVDLADIKRVKSTHGGTVNDVLLSAIAGGLRSLLLGRGESLAADATIRTVVPVSMRTPGQVSGGNKVSAVFVDLPVGRSDPLERLAAITAQMDRVKRSGEALSVATIIDAAPFVPPSLIAAGGRLAAHVPQKSIGTVTTNVPGPQHPLHLMGRRMLAMIPFVPLGPRVQIAFAMFSYDGGVWCGVTADYDAIPDVALACEGIGEALGSFPAQTRKT